ncbi:MAG: IreB family regulatory phosphoprotein [Eubacterium sp.]
MQEINNTQYFKVDVDSDYDVRDVIASVYTALTEKGYNPVNQIVGYLMSGDPTYITSHKGARSLIMRAERDEIIEVFLRIISRIILRINNSF